MRLTGYIMPHPPILLAGIGGPKRYEGQATLEACERLGREAADFRPDTVIIISPHGPMFRNAVCINAAPWLEGDFGAFGHPEITVSRETDLPFVEALSNLCTEKALSAVELTPDRAEEYGTTTAADHGAMVPLSFFPEDLPFRVVSITYGLLRASELFRFGRLIVSCAENMDRDVLIVASGDMSHCLKDDGPYHATPEGPVFDATIRDLVAETKWLKIRDYDMAQAKAAGECGLRSLQILSGAVSAFRTKTEVLSYEGPWGVEYLTAKITTMGRYEKNACVKLARHAVAYRVNYGKEYDYIPDKLRQERKACFVSLHSLGDLRGCMGSLEPHCPSLGEEIIRNAQLAALEDPRFPPVTKDELEDLEISVDVLSAPEPVGDLKSLDPKRYGVVVCYGKKRAVLLPNLEGVDTVEDQLRIVRAKAGIPEDATCEIWRFEVERYE